jgi:hypothetical protein
VPGYFQPRLAALMVDEEIVLAHVLSRPAAAFHCNAPVVVAMAAVYMVQVVVDQIIKVCSMRNFLVPAMGAVLVVGFMPLARMLWCATIRILAGNLDSNTVVVIAVAHVHVAFVKIGSLVSMPDGYVPAACAMNVIMLFVAMVTVHF